MANRVKKPKAIVEPFEQLIYEVRNQRVMLDADLARVYGVTTGRFNEAVRRNKGRFPQDFAFKISAVEL